jgi:hypothetical protein
MSDYHQNIVRSLAPEAWAEFAEWRREFKKPLDAPGVEGAAKDYELSRSAMEARWAQGVSDGRTALFLSPWLAPMPPEIGARTFDVVSDARHDHLLHA